MTESFSTRTRRMRRTGDAGNAVVEAAILAPVLIMFLAGLLIAMRIQHGNATVSQAAADAARQASIARTPSQARAAATASARTTLRNRDLHCIPQIRLDLTGFSRPVGEPAKVSAHVTCRVKLADIALPGIPGFRTVTKSHWSPIDIYRAR